MILLTAHREPRPDGGCEFVPDGPLIGPWRQAGEAVAVILPGPVAELEERLAHAACAAHAPMDGGYTLVGMLLGPRADEAALDHLLYLLDDGSRGTLEADVDGPALREALADLASQEHGLTLRVEALREALWLTVGDAQRQARARVPAQLARPGTVLVRLDQLAGELAERDRHRLVGRQERLDVDGAEVPTLRPEAASWWRPFPNYAPTCWLAARDGAGLVAELAALADAQANTVADPRDAGVWLQASGGEARLLTVLGDGGAGALGSTLPADRGEGTLWLPAPAARALARAEGVAALTLHAAGDQAVARLGRLELAFRRVKVRLPERWVPVAERLDAWVADTLGARLDGAALRRLLDEAARAALDPTGRRPGGTAPVKLMLGESSLRVGPPVGDPLGAVAVTLADPARAEDLPQVVVLPHGPLAAVLSPGPCRLGWHPERLVFSAGARVGLASTMQRRTR